MKVVDVVFMPTLKNHEMSFMWLLLCQKRKLQELMLKITRCRARLESGIRPRKSNQCLSLQDTSTTGLVCRQGFGTPCILNVVAFVVVVCVYRRESYLVDTDGGNIVRPSGTRIPETWQKAGRPVTQSLEYLTTHSLALSFTRFCCPPSLDAIEACSFVHILYTVLEDTPDRCTLRAPIRPAVNSFLIGQISFANSPSKPRIEIMI